MRTGPGEDYDGVRDLKSGRRFAYLDAIEGWRMMTDGNTGCFVYVDADDTDVNY